MPRYNEGIRLTYDECRTAEVLLRRSIGEILSRIQELKPLDDGGFRIICPSSEHLAQLAV